VTLALVVSAASPSQAIPYSDLVLADNPIAYYRFSETSGSTAFDTTGMNNATYFNTPDQTAAGPRPPDFPGFEGTNSATGFSDDAVNTSISLDNLSAFTLEAWIRPTVTPVADRIGLIGQNDTIELGFINPTTMQLWTPATGGLDVPYNPQQIGEWTHIVGLGSGSFTQLFFNGQLVGQLDDVVIDYGASPFNVNIGGDGVFDSSGNSFEGANDEVAIYTNALSADRVLAHYNAATVPEPASVGLLGLGLVALLLRKRPRR